MKKVLFISIIMVTFFLVGCSSFKWTIFVASDESVDINSPSVSESNQESRQSNTPKSNSKTSNEYKKFDSYGYNVEADDLYVLAEVLYASDELYGSYRLFDAIGIHTKGFSKAFSIERKQISKIESGLKPVIDSSTDESLFDYLIEKQLFGFHQYKIGEIGPAGGWVFFDKGYYSDGWRFLEAAPKDLSGLFTNLGSARAECRDYSVNGYDDWYLPTQEWLNLMYENLHANSIGGFSDALYMSSTTSSGFYSDLAIGQHFLYGGQGCWGTTSHHVRPIRNF